MNYSTDINQWISLSILGLLFLAFAAPASAQSDHQKENQFLTTKNNLQSAVNSYDKAGVIKAKYALQPYAESSNKELKTLAYYYIGYADYRLNTQFPDIKEDQKEKFLDEAIEYLEKSVDLKPGFTDAQALLGSTYGLKATGMLSGMKYGPKSNQALEKAMTMEPQNPRTHMLQAIGLLYKPSMWGGSTEGAIEAFKKAADLFKSYQPKNKRMPDWGHAEVYAWLGKAYEKNGQLKKANVAYKRALSIDPNYGWVKYNLIPELEKKMK